MGMPSSPVLAFIDLARCAKNSYALWNTGTVFLYTIHTTADIERRQKTLFGNGTCTSFLNPHVINNFFNMSWKHVEATLKKTGKTSERPNAPPPPMLESGGRRVQAVSLKRGRRHDEDSDECVKFPPLEAFSKVPKIPLPGSAVNNLKAQEPTDFDESFEAFALRFNSNRDDFIFH